ncbi:hypothetical protein BO85DRAFT_452057 [Aspergillus piperis CBS 112811]|uniref:Aminoglycoside phosphotransferase domain-containing protein n=1 Tax=Aspergillus piperis CBS 112811 TaxID=1448313 RepID=A0A8G1QVX9_9EURO|nr:hypothetical protein BO85DRAFT_452057 [Aspergillus piperis CBS 112811]RAH54633.1 hypothetical protein BO85DRAFT_452057 [Aspergillus piperis CBS 112811]
MMEERSWAQQMVDRFFEIREFPTQLDCDDHARRITGASTVREVDIPGSLSYTVLCTGSSDERPGLIVSFRQPESVLDQTVIELARFIHGDLVPEATFYGNMPDSDPPLLVYTMACLSGSPCLQLFSTETELSPREEARYMCFVKHLARYFARCWLNPQPVDPTVSANYRDAIYHQLEKIRNSAPVILSSTTISELECSLPDLFNQEYVQVLTHNDLSQTNILISEGNFEITGIVDWSLAKVLPFGMELDTLLLSTGYMDLSGWHNYTCRERMISYFWDEFWAHCRVFDDKRQHEIRTMAMQATKIGAVLRYAFQRNADGSPSEELTTSKWALKTLKTLLCC